ncbi:LOW QUALITY PROTEIN: coiled-coil domain-containing protein 68-like [Opisthocomus hoazin]|uniref:LOW QUALITY PROTEIN: coiled-coil domain-containing protein 68-like n=1 Tax=Opisthocomus hoazin TaxID=30419 RepID=UPI003F5298F2
MAAPSEEQKNARIVMTTLLLTEQITREDRGSEGNYVLYGSSCSQITEEAEYVKKQLPPVSGSRAEAQSSGWSCSPVATTMKETEEQLLLVSRENQVLKIKLEATREAGVQALRSASQNLYENYLTRSEEAKKRHENEKQQIQASNLQREEELQKGAETAGRLAARIREKHTRIAEMEERVRRMEEEKKTLIEKKMSFEKMLQQMMSRNEDGKRCLDLQRQISTLREQIQHLQLVIRVQHHGLRAVIQEAEELKKEIGSQDKQIEHLAEKLAALEAQRPARLWSIPLPDAYQAKEAGELKGRLDVCLLPSLEGLYLRVGTCNSLRPLVTAKHLQHAPPLYKSPCGSGAAELHLRKIKLGLNKIKQR